MAEELLIPDDLAGQGWESYTLPGVIFTRLLEPVYRTENGGYRIGLVIQERHCNLNGYCHGGLLATMADHAMGTFLRSQVAEDERVATLELNSHFIAAARQGTWIEAIPRITQRSSRTAFMDCVIVTRDGTVILRAVTIFRISKVRD